MQKLVKGLPAHYPACFTFSTLLEQPVPDRFVPQRSISAKHKRFCVGMYKLRPVRVEDFLQASPIC
jgi:hypothetical protein